MLQYSFVEGMLEKRGPYRQEHLDLLTDLTEKKECLIGGAFAEPGKFAIFALPYRTALQYAHALTVAPGY
jgi:hypothetical protein